ncbi:AraC family transcriptional regulator [Marinobacter sp. C2H3]|uniref:AraC family transcriptional regulator n=1 Tax=Marinobacter sp. C2H3 TaxID=3119003 RepID=UPI00300ECD98
MPDTTLSLELRTYNDEGQRHDHRHHQLVLPVAGTLHLSVNGTGGEVSGQQAGVIPSGSDHGFAASDQNRFLVADIPEALAPALDRLPYFVPLDPALAHYVRFLHAQVTTAETGAATQHQMLQLLLQLLQERYGNPRSLDRRIAAARQLLDDQFHRSISAAELASVAHLSVRQLNALFREQLGVTPHQYLTERRMARARQMLEQTGASLQQVADAVGYQSMSTFSDRFRRHFGHPPGHFRRSVR